MNPSATFLARRQNIGSDSENSTIEKQRKELQLLIGELKDRDKELNDMVAVHQRQLLSWEEDRQKVLTLEERCSKLEGELHKRTEIIRSLMKKVKVLESNQMECQTALQKTQLQLQEMAQKATHSSLLSEDLEARNENLSNTLVELSAQVGQLQAREQALTTMIKLKDKDIIEAVNHIADCSGKFKLLEHALRDAKMVESSIVKEKQDYKQKLKALKIEVSKLKEDLNEKTTENNDQREEIIRLKQEKSCLHDELVFTEREKRKDELLDIAKSKQERTNSELHNLRQIYVKQQSDLQFLNFNVENSQQFIQIYDSKMEESKTLESSGDMCLSDLENSHPKVGIKGEKSPLKDNFEALLAQHNRSEKSPCDVCKEKRLQISTALGEKSVITLSSLFTKDFTEKQKSWPLGGKISIEPESKIASCTAHAKSPKDNGAAFQRAEAEPSAACAPPAEKPWRAGDVCPGLAGAFAHRQAEKRDGDAREPLARPDIRCCLKSEGCPEDSDVCDPACCHPSNLVVEAPGHMSDAEWINIFKPSKTQRLVLQKTVCTCSGSVGGGDCNSLASELTAIQRSHCLAKCTAREDETEASPDEKSSPTSLLINKDAALASEKDDFSPTSKLQRLLAESRQMVTNLELSTLLPLGGQDRGSGTRSNLEISEESAPKNTLVRP
ncbi:PREDICTED: coiled-coil domain-containing protein 62 isoform X2 [Chinchilla lanigera]|uniref:coiled-coil domain-containing protein 62 isoform X2 n=1 Tax=Chinchilla lanigera TaxID=34839 RepID=UPI00038EAE1D|nr:PREDICTED: coiled-coil domain-containing protein 62 isoform X2 [Chinchilla lanigera]